MTPSTAQPPLQSTAAAVSPSRSAGALTWGFVIATYQRPDALHRAIKLALLQTRRPAEIVVVDGSADWQTTRDHVRETLAPLGGADVRWEYRPATRLGVSAQRNQAVALSRADVVFLVDDDTWMYPFAAERILRVYEADPDGAIAGLMPLLTDVPPTDAPAPPIEDRTSSTSSTTPPSLPPLDTGFNVLKKKVQRVHDWYKGPMLPPELERMHERRLPSLVASANRVQMLHGCRMTFRRRVALEHPFDERIQYQHEESEMCLRARASGALLQIHEPLMFHAKATGQLTPRRGADNRRRLLLGHAYMCRKLGGADPAIASFVLRYHRRVTLADLALGLARRNFAYFRGCRQATRGVKAILTAPDDRVGDVYLDAIKSQPA